MFALGLSKRNRLAMKMKSTMEIEDVFLAYGQAAYHAQLMEYDLVSVWMLDSVTQGVSITRRDLLKFQEEWGKRTFGQLLTPLQKSNLISEEIKGFFEQLRRTRNRLAHNFFIERAIDLQSNDGRERAVAELHRMNAVLHKGQQFIGDILKKYLNDFGVDPEAIMRQVLQRDDDGES